MNTDTATKTTGLYFTDNGAIYCHDHLGYTAKATGRDISGQPIARVTFADRADAAAQGWPLCCECCGTTGL